MALRPEDEGYPRVRDRTCCPVRGVGLNSHMTKRSSQATTKSQLSNAGRGRTAEDPALRGGWGSGWGRTSFLWPREGENRNRKGVGKSAERRAGLGHGKGLSNARRTRLSCQSKIHTAKAGGKQGGSPIVDPPRQEHPLGSNRSAKTSEKRGQPLGTGRLRLFVGIMAGPRGAMT